MSEKGATELLKSMGLSQYEAQAYMALYIRSPQNASSISQESGVPRGRVYDVLQSLTEHGLIASQLTKGKANVYVLVPHEESLNSLKDRRLDELEETRKGIEDTYSRLVELLDSVEREETPQTSMEPLTIIRGVAARDAYTRKLLTDAQETVLSNFTPSELRRYEPSIREAMSRGVGFTFMLPEDERNQVMDIVEGSTVYSVSSSRTENSTLGILGKIRPPLAIIDEGVGILFLHESDDALLVRSPELISQAKVVLMFFKEIADLKLG
ncbi:TrmB family transcriptional regulator [Candidatus Bathyarchaeota archaeon]|nr:TrmB family transcriptional regulator [Candidatus Bathyarchaeota archaeon]